MTHHSKEKIKCATSEICFAQNIGRILISSHKLFLVSFGVIFFMFPWARKYIQLPISPLQPLLLSTLGYWYSKVFVKEVSKDVLWACKLTILHQVAVTRSICGTHTICGSSTALCIWLQAPPQILYIEVVCQRQLVFGSHAPFIEDADHPWCCCRRRSDKKTFT